MKRCVIDGSGFWIGDVDENYNPREGESIVNADPPLVRREMDMLGLVYPRWNAEAEAWEEGTTAEDISIWERDCLAQKLRRAGPGPDARLSALEAEASRLANAVHPGEPAFTEKALDVIAAMAYLSRLQMEGAVVGTDDQRLRASALYPGWTPGSHAAGEYYNAEGQTWECFQAYDNGVYPDIRPGEAAWYTFNRPLHGTSPETARPFVPVQGAHDMYRAGEYMIWTDGVVYRCAQDTNFSPEEYAAAWEGEWA